MVGKVLSYLPDIDPQPDYHIRPPMLMMAATGITVMGMFTLSQFTETS
jgi:hypothetical protein